MPYSELPQQAIPQPQGNLNVPQFIQSARQNGVPDDQIYHYLQQNGAINNQPQDTAQLHDTGSFGGNLMNSAGNFVSGLGHAIAHPIDTVTTLGKGLIGAGENAASYLTTGKSAAESKGPDQFTQVADNIGSFIKQRYGSVDSARKTAYQDPVGFLADAATVLSGAGSLVGKAGDVSKIGELSNAGEMIGKAGEAINPINMGGKVLGKIGQPISDFVGNKIANTVGATTGSGGSSIKGVFNAAREDGLNNEAIQAARGGISEDQVIKNAQEAFDKIKQNRNTTYQQQLQKIKGVDGEVDYMPAVQEFRTQLQNNGITIKNGELQFENARGFQNPSEQAVLQNAYERIERWGDLPKNNTVYGLDTLKQQIGDFIEQANGKAKPVLSQTRKVLSDILKQNNDYKNLVEPYETTSNLIDDLKSNLSLNSKNPETVLKKLASAFKQDNEFRQSFIDELNKVSDQDIVGQISGLNMKDLVNKGKLTSLLELGAVFAHPHLLPSLLVASPRAVAEFANALGFTAKQIDTGLEFLKKAKPIINSSTLNAASRVTSANQVKSPSKNPGKPSASGIRVRIPASLANMQLK